MVLTEFVLLFFLPVPPQALALDSCLRNVVHLEDIINLKNEMNTKLDTKVDNVAWKEACSGLSHRYASCRCN
eukprot:3617945-Amphidinium_carterae.1